MNKNEEAGLTMSGLVLFVSIRLQDEGDGGKIDQSINQSLQLYFNMKLHLTFSERFNSLSDC